MDQSKNGGGQKQAPPLKRSFYGKVAKFET